MSEIEHFQPIPLIDAALAIGARQLNSIPHRKYVRQVTQDSRAVTYGTLFFALRGNRVDGHDFVREVGEGGAVAAVVERRVDAPVPQLLVPSTLIAMGELARYYRTRFDIPLVAVTGSVGKTSTKDMIADVLSSKYRTHRSRKNFNNELGVPIELFHLTDEHQASVMELAMRGAGQIKYLGRIARPTIAVITNVGIAHIEHLGSIDNIAAAKAEIIESLDTEALLVLNRDDKYFDFFSEAAEAAACKVVSFGTNPDANFRISDLHTNERGNPAFSINGVPIVMLQCAGRHHAMNAAASFAVATHLRVRPEDIADKLSAFQTPERRGQFSFAKSGAIILDSTYNAAPLSVKATLEILADIRRKGKRTVAVIGDILELGEHSEKAHRYVGDIVRDLQIDFLVTVGEQSRVIGEQAKLSGWEHFSDVEQAADFLLRETTAEDAISVQGSRGLFLETIVEALELGRRKLGYESSFWRGGRE